MSMSHGGTGREAGASDHMITKDESARERWMFWHWSRERHGLRAWWHFRAKRPRCIGMELGWWHSFCHIGMYCDDEGWNLSIGLPPLFVHLSIEGFPLWRPMVKHVFTWENPPREVWLPDRRECRVTIRDWALHIVPWGKTMEWAARDPWWVRGIQTPNLKDVVLGRKQYRKDVLSSPRPIRILMPEGPYAALATRERQTWWRRFGLFRDVRESWAFDIPKGIPFAGKGENAWDCVDDGLFGMSASGTLDEACLKVCETVMERRRRYGAPSSQAIADAMEV